MAQNRRSFWIDGLDELTAMLQQLPEQVARDIAPKVLRRHLRPVVATAKAKAPVYKGTYGKGHHKSPRKPGQLRDSIKLVIKHTNYSIQGRVVVNDPLGHLLEYGHKSRKGMKRERNAFSKYRKARFDPNAKDFVDARPFMRPAIEQHKDEVLRGVEQDILMEIAKRAR